MTLGPILSLPRGIKHFKNLEPEFKNFIMLLVHIHDISPIVFHLDFVGLQD